VFYSENVFPRMVHFLASAYPSTLRARDSHGRLPLHNAVRRNAVLRDKPRTIYFVHEGRGTWHGRDNGEMVGFSSHRRLDDLLLASVLSNALPMRLPLHQRRFLTDAPFLASAWPDALQLGDNEGRLPLHHAVQAGVLLHVRVLASAWPDALRTGDNEGRLPLHVAARHNEGHRPPFRNDRERIEGQREMIDLVQFVASEWRNALQVRDNGRWLPLHHAARHGSLKVVQCITHEYPLALLMPQGLGWSPLRLLQPSGTTRTWTL
jgi:hypothetical protein